MLSSLRLRQTKQKQEGHKRVLLLIFIYFDIYFVLYTFRVTGLEQP
jgi:uncharacterized membrane protein YozB (DUF420 family)